MTEGTATRSAERDRRARSKRSAPRSAAAPAGTASQLGLTVRTADTGPRAGDRSPTSPAMPRCRRGAGAAAGDRARRGTRVAARPGRRRRPGRDARALRQSAPTAIPPAAPQPRCARSPAADIQAAYRASLAARQRHPDPVRRHRSGRRRWRWPSAISAAGGRRPRRRPARRDRPGPRRAPRSIVIDMPGAGQAAVAVARNGLARSDPRFYPRAGRQCGARRRLQRAAEPGDPDPPRPLLRLGQQLEPRRAAGPVRRRRPRPATTPPRRCSA